MPVPFPGRVKFLQLASGREFWATTETNDEITSKHTDDDMSDDSEEDDEDILHDDEDVFLAELRSEPANDDVSVAASGFSSTNDTSLTENVLNDSADPQPVG